MSNEKPELNPQVTLDGGSINKGKSVAIEDSSTPILDAVVGTDPPIEKAHPGLQPALVFASYPLVLIVFVFIVACYFFFFRSDSKESVSLPAHTESTKEK